MNKFLAMILRALVFAVLVGSSLVVASPTYASTINVGCNVNELVNAINTANTNAYTDTLELASNCTYTLTTPNNTDSTLGPNGLPVITSDMTINGNHATITRISGVFRFFQVNTNAKLTMNELTLTGGYPGTSETKNGRDGGALYNNGTCTINDSNISGNSAGDGGEPDFEQSNGGPGGSGGAIYNTGTLFLDRVTLNQNLAGSGASNDDKNYSGTSGGHGGGIYNLGTLTIMDSQLTNNMTPNGIGNVNGGAVGDGGGIYNLGTVTESTSTFSGNRTGNGIGYFSFSSGGKGGAFYNAGTAHITTSTFTSNGTGSGLDGDLNAGGGAIFNDAAGQLSLEVTRLLNNSTGAGANFGKGRNGGSGSGVANLGTARIKDSLFDSNTTGAGGVGNVPSSLGGDGGLGAGIYSSGTLELKESTFINNETGPGGEGGSNGGKGGSGGGLKNDGTATLVNITFHANRTGSGGLGPIVGYGGDGGAIANQGNLYLTNSTLQGNQVGGMNLGETTFWGNGGGIAHAGGTFLLQNTIIAKNLRGDNCFGSLQNGGGNLRWPQTDASCVGSDANPKLGPLQDNGGATQTMALAPDSAAINAAVDANCPTADQRGIVRPQGKHCDSGAFELEPPTAPTLVAPPDNKKFDQLQVNLKWTAAERVVSYQVIVRIDSAKGKKIANEKVTTLKYQTPVLERGHWYYWRIKPCSKVGCANSAVWRFRVK